MTVQPYWLRFCYFGFAILVLLFWFCYFGSEVIYSDDHVLIVLVLMLLVPRVFFISTLYESRKCIIIAVEFSNKTRLPFWGFAGF